MIKREQSESKKEELEIKNQKTKTKNNSVNNLGDKNTEIFQKVGQST